MNTELKNVYEGLIQDMIVAGINGMAPVHKKTIFAGPYFMLEVQKEDSLWGTLLKCEIR